MSIIEGYLTEVETKEGKTKSGKPWTSYRGQVQGTWYSFGFDKPPVSRGDFIRAEVGQVKGYDQIVRAERITPPAAQEALPKLGNMQASATQPTSSPRGSQQQSIHYQSARKDALQFVELLVSQDALPISSAKTSAGKAKRYEELLALVDKLTVQYYFDAETHRNLDRIEDAGKDGPAPAALPEDAQDTAVVDDEPKVDWS